MTNNTDNNYNDDSWQSAAKNHQEGPLKPEERLRLTMKSNREDLLKTATKKRLSEQSQDPLLENDNDNGEIDIISQNPSVKKGPLMQFHDPSLDSDDNKAQV